MTFELKPNAEQYSWTETPAETALRDHLAGAYQTLGQVHSLGTTIEALGGADLRDLVQGMQSDEEYTGIIGDHSTAIRDYPYARLGIVLVGKYTGYAGEPIEPYRLGISLGSGAGTMVMNMTIPSKAAQLGIQMEGPLTSTENRPPHLTLQLRSVDGDPGKLPHMNGIITAAKEAVKDAPISGDRERGPASEEDRQGMLGTLDVLREVIKHVDRHQREQPLTEEAMQALLRFVELQLPL